MNNIIALAFVFAFLFLLIGLYVATPKGTQTVEIFSTNAKIAQVWMSASAIMVAIGYFTSKL